MASADKKAEKKKVKLAERITQLELDVFNALKHKSSSQAEINLPAKQQEIAKLKTQLAQMK